MSATIYMETFGLSLRKNGNCLAVRKEGEKNRDFPVCNVGSVVVSADGVSISGGAVRLCQENSIPIFFLPKNGGRTSVLAPVESLRPELQAGQIRAQEDPECVFAIVSGFVQGKIGNQLSLVKYFRNSRKMRNGDFSEMLENYGHTVRQILDGMKKGPDTTDVSLMRGRFFSAEGRAATAYWQMISTLIPEEAEFPGRKHKGAKDAVNSMLNYAYAILGARVHQAILQAGLSTYFSFLHSPQPGRASLVYDLIEEFRPWAADRVVVGMMGKGRKVETDEKGKLKIEDRRFLIESLEKRWEKDGLRKLLKQQVKMLCRAIEEKESYVPVRFLSSGAVKSGTS